MLESCIHRVVSTSNHGVSAVCDVHFARHSSYTEELLSWLSDRLDRLYAIGMHLSALASHLKETIEALPCVAGHLSALAGHLKETIEAASLRWPYFSDCVALASVLASVDGCCKAYNRRSHDCVFGMLSDVLGVVVPQRLGVRLHDKYGILQLRVPRRLRHEGGFAR